MRIASLAPSVTEILYELGAENEIVASTIFCDYPESAKLLPKVGSWVNIDYHKLRATAPDIVFTSSVVQDKITAELKAQNFQVVNINPKTLAEVVESYDRIGSLVGRKDVSSGIVNELYKKIMASYLQPSSGSLRVYSEEWANPPMAAGNWVPEIVSLAGGIVGIGQAGNLSQIFELSELVKFDPEIIILHHCGMGERVETESLYKRAGWEGLSAVKNKQVHVIHDSLLNRPTSRLFAGLERLREILQSTIQT